jgi:antitoxin (DNA-binding transcriptional repressor) of toxin-antitoxin stability system
MRLLITAMCGNITTLRVNIATDCGKTTWRTQAVDRVKIRSDSGKTLELACRKMLPDRKESCVSWLDPQGADNLIIRLRGTPVRTQLTVTEVVRNFAEYVNRVVYRRESFVLLRGNRPVAELRPIPAGTRLGDLPGLLASLPRLSPDEAADFAADIGTARKDLSHREVVDPWQS